MAQRLKSLPLIQETWVRSLGWEDRLEKEMATHSNILARRIPWTEEPGGLQSMGSQSQTRMSDLTNLMSQGNISSKDGLDKGQKWCGPNRSRDIKT